MDNLIKQTIRFEEMHTTKDVQTEKNEKKFYLILTQLICRELTKTLFPT